MADKVKRTDIESTSGTQAPKLIDVGEQQFIDDITDTSVNETDNAGDKASERTRSLADEQYNKSKTDLNAPQNSNYAIDGGQYGRINNRNYTRTLRLAREADAYNNAPQAHMFSIGTRKTGGIKDLGTGYEKPKITTMETRAMDQSFNLDTNQKQLAQELQAAVNRKDYDTFRMLYEQLYGIKLSEMQAEVAMRQFSRQTEIQEFVTLHSTEFQSYLQQYLGYRSAATVMALVPYDQQLASLVAYNLTGGPAPSLSDRASQNFMLEYMQKRLGTGWRGADAKTVSTVMSEARVAQNVLGYKESNMNMKALTSTTGFFTGWGDRSKGKSIAKQIDKDWDAAK